MVPLLVTRPFSSPASLRPLEAAFDVLHAGGFDSETALVAYRPFCAYSLGFVMTEAAGFFCGVARDPTS